jgi:hypothetical protein
MTKDLSKNIKEMLDEVDSIEGSVRSLAWEIDNQDLPNIEEMNDTISEAVRTLEDISLSGDVERINSSDLDDISDRTSKLKEQLTVLIDSIKNTGLDENTMRNGYNMFSRTSTYLNSTIVNGVNNVAANILFSSAPHNVTYNEFYLLLCTLEQQLEELFTKLNGLAAENEIHDLSDYVVTVKLESKRDLAKHKRNYEMEENNG